MRHGKKFNHLGRKSAHRKAMLRNMANSLIMHKRITTTVAKAKALRSFVEPLITKAKDQNWFENKLHKVIITLIKLFFLSLSTSLLAVKLEMLKHLKLQLKQQ